MDKEWPVSHGTSKQCQGGKLQRENTCHIMETKERYIHTFLPTDVGVFTSGANLFQVQNWSIWKAHDDKCNTIRSCRGSISRH